MKDLTIFSIVSILLMIGAFVTCTRVTPTTQVVGDMTITTIVPIPSWIASLYSNPILGSITGTILGGLAALLILALLIGTGLVYRRLRYGTWMGGPQ